MAEPKHPEPEAMSGPATVAVVNDDPDACEVVARVLDAAGHRVTRLYQPDDALAVLATDPPSAVVIDLVASRPDAAVRLLDTIRDHSNEKVRAARILVIGDENASAPFTWASGTDGFLPRPMHANALVAALAEVLARPEEDRVPFRTAAPRADPQQPTG